MHHFKLLALDLDGTLLNSNCKIPNSTISIVKEAAKRAHITIATGRTFYSAHHFAKQLGIDIPLIACNGTIIKTALSGEVMFRNPLSANVIATVVKLCKSNNVYYHGYSENNIYLVKENEITYNDGDTKLAPCIVVDNLTELEENTLLKLTIMGTESEMIKLSAIIKDETNAIVIQITTTHLEIIEHGATKGTSLKLLADKLQVTRDSIIACGDGQNDIEMIKWAGLGTAVKNANMRLKTHADYIAINESSAGVEEIIRKFILV